MLRFISVLFLVAFGPTLAAAQAVDANWPSKPIHLIVPFPAGAVTDLVARIVANKVSEKLGATIVIENKPGASGGIGSIAVANASPDGYTMGLGTASTLAVGPSLNSHLAYDPLKDFAAVSLIGNAPYVLVVNSKVPAHNVAELIALAKAKPKALNYSTVGPASLAQFAATLFSRMAKVELTAIPYKSATPAALDIAEGRIEMQFGAVAASLPYVRQGTLRALAVTSKHRLDILPDVPTMEEAGLPGYEAVLWVAFVMPAKTPEAIVARLNKATREAVADPAVQKALSHEVLQPESSTPEQLHDRMRDEITKWRTLAKEAGFKMQ